jgi:hypothetical protein
MLSTHNYKLLAWIQFHLNKKIEVVALSCYVTMK